VWVAVAADELPVLAGALRPMAASSSRAATATAMMNTHKLQQQSMLMFIILDWKFCFKKNKPRHVMHSKTFSTHSAALVRRWQIWHSAAQPEAYTRFGGLQLS
jgi:hypothetical protein